MKKLISDEEIQLVIDNTYTLYVINKCRWLDGQLELDQDAMLNVNCRPIYRAKLSTDTNVLNKIRNYLIVNTDVFAKTSYEGDNNQFQLEMYEYNCLNLHYRMVYDERGYIVITDFTGFKYKD
jgi:hypothetical protein